MAELLGKLRQVEVRKQAQALLDRDPATTVTVDNPHGAAMAAAGWAVGPCQIGSAKRDAGHRLS
ncbi:hypothetical protein [Nocardia sp. NPDC004750]